MMDYKYIEKLVKLLDNSSITDIELEEDGKKLKISKKQRSSYAAHPHYVSHQKTSELQIIDQEPPLEVRQPAPDSNSDYHQIVSPIVGTFYRAPSPDAEPYVKVGDIVSKGTVLCVIEAMKLMNEIESDTDGKIIKVLVDNSQPVEYNQPLFLIEQK